MADFTYKKRIADSVLERKLNATGAVLVEGAKWCGKTTSAEQQARTVNYISDQRPLSGQATHGISWILPLRPPHWE